MKHDTIVDIIIPMWNHAALTVRCLEKLVGRTHTPFRVLLCDDGSAPENFHRVMDHAQKMLKIWDYHRNPVNRGFACIVNEGLRMSCTKHICILNNDVLVSEGWLGKMLDLMGAHPKIGAVGPYTDNIASSQKTGVPGMIMNERPAGFKEIKPPAGISYFCTLLRREAMLDVGLLCEDFTNGGEDDDYNDRLRAAGWSVGISQNCWVHHDHHATIDDIENYPSLQAKNQALLKQRREERKSERISSTNG